MSLTLMIWRDLRFYGGYMITIFRKKTLKPRCNEIVKFAEPDRIKYDKYNQNMTLRNVSKTFQNGSFKNVL